MSEQLKTDVQMITAALRRVIHLTKNPTRIHKIQLGTGVYVEQVHKHTVRLWSRMNLALQTGHGTADYNLIDSIPSKSLSFSPPNEH